MISTDYLCFAACLQIAVREIAKVKIDQAIIANQLGIVLPIGFDCSELVKQGVTNIRFDSDAALWGIEPIVADIDGVLKQADVGLKCWFEPISMFQDWEFEDRIAALTESGQFPIVGFEYNTVFGESATEIRGHCALAYGVHKTNGESAVEIYDPGPRHAGLRSVDSYSLYRACRRKHGGLWLLAPLVYS